MALKLLNVGLGAFTTAGPDDGFAFAVDLHHVLSGFGLGVAEDAPDDYGDVAHEVYRIVEDDDLPGLVEVFGFVEESGGANVWGFPGLVFRVILWSP